MRCRSRTRNPLRQRQLTNKVRRLTVTTSRHRRRSTSAQGRPAAPSTSARAGCGLEPFCCRPKMAVSTAVPSPITPSSTASARWSCPGVAAARGDAGMLENLGQIQRQPDEQQTGKCGRSPGDGVGEVSPGRDVVGGHARYATASRMRSAAARSAATSGPSRSSSRDTAGNSCPGRAPPKPFRASGRPPCAPTPGTRTGP